MSMFIPPDLRDNRPAEDNGARFRGAILYYLGHVKTRGAYEMEMREALFDPPKTQAECDLMSRTVNLLRSEGLIVPVPCASQYGRAAVRLNKAGFEELALIEGLARKLVEISGES